ncbi:DNA polymerase IV [Yinghuangia soli]|uniref:DNA polymerase IV n=1 Tax=Yinghuangia soli TaxID=2908204 RepID=A0AA41U2X9_9ACTN|nr:DNA polymerase IV [Yinghuangia soli]MCF2527549.1 DNA polymerase IV [Yinghuangia soli]
MRQTPAILHLDMDAFYAAVEQVAKPSLRGKPVIVGGVGGRGVVATASYEARKFGVRSAMSTAEARRRCPNAAFLIPRFAAYREVSDLVMGLLGQLSPLVEPLSLDEAFVDLAAGPYADGLDTARATALAVRLRADILAATGLTASVGLAPSKLVAKIASEAAKPDGLVVVPPDQVRATLDPLPVRALWGVGPATAEAMRKVGITTIADIAATDADELVRLFGQAHGRALHEHALGIDDRPVVAERDAKSVSVEDTFEVDLVDRTRITAELDRLAARCVERLRAAGRSGRTVVVKMRRYDFSTLTRSETLRGPTDDLAVVRETVHRLAAQVDFTGGIRLLGVGVASLADFAQQDLFGDDHEDAAGDAVGVADATETTDATEISTGPAGSAAGAAPRAVDAIEPDATSGAAPDAALAPGVDPAPESAAGDPADPEAGAYGRVPVFHPGRFGSTRWLPGQDVTHTEHGPGWVQGSGVGRVTVRFETPGSAPGRIRTYLVDDPDLTPSAALPLVRRTELDPKPEPEPQLALEPEPEPEPAPKPPAEPELGADPPPAPDSP